VKEDVEHGLLRFEEQDHGFVCDHRFSAELPVFAGHFPGRPVLPGIFLLELLRQGLQRYCGRPVLLAKIIKAQFTSAIEPGEVVTTSVQVEAQDRGADQVRARFLVGDRACAELRATFVSAARREPA
jgi:3-hydroxyacyl-[acyl-carrier-protein] dehydratase